MLYWFDVDNLTAAARYRGRFVLRMCPVEELAEDCRLLVLLSSYQFQVRHACFLSDSSIILYYLHVLCDDKYHLG